MAEGWGQAIVAITLGIISVALVAVVVSKQAATGAVITDYGNAISKMIGAAVSPVTGGNSFGSSSLGATDTIH